MIFEGLTWFWMVVFSEKDVFFLDLLSCRFCYIKG